MRTRSLRRGIRRLALLIVALLVAQTGCAFAEGYLPQKIEGSGTDFTFDTKTGKANVPDCILLGVHAFCTEWDVTDSFFESGDSANIFDYIADAKVAEMPRPEESKYALYEYGGLELFVQSATDSKASARIRMWPRDPDNYDHQEGEQHPCLVDLEIVYYQNYGLPDEKSTLAEYQLDSYGLWNTVVEFSMEYYLPTALEDTVCIEYHSLQNDPGAPATPSENPPVLKDRALVQAIVKALVNGEKLEHNMVGSDYMHLRFVDEKGNKMNVYLQNPRDDEDGKIYARMGTYCYRIDKDAIQNALNAAGIPFEMMI